MPEPAPPNRIPWPPLLLLATLAAGLALGRLAPLPVLAAGFGGALRLIGLALVATALALDVWAFVTLRRRGTTILPHAAASALVTDGPFALSRNPIYLGNLLLTAGAGLALDEQWLVLLSPVLGLGLRELAIRREERHLAARFGEEWRDYSGKVRRWL